MKVVLERLSPIAGYLCFSLASKGSVYYSTQRLRAYRGVFFRRLDLPLIKASAQSEGPCQ